MKACKENCDPTSAAPARALYVHVPFCRAKCRYCDFYSVPIDAAAGQCIQALHAELGLHRDCLTKPLASVFLGGGTPSALGPELLGDLLAPLREWVDGRTEFSMEANPGAFDAALARAAREGGVNRPNFGVQSFQQRELAILGRIHGPGDVRQAIELARAGGFDTVGVDLIYAIPGQTIETWRDSLRQAIDLGIDHLSCYALTFEEGTPFYEDLRQGRVEAADESLQRELYDVAVETAVAAGLEHYELSNFARPGRRCRHNLTYWHNETYLGIGPAAASYIAGVRRTNAADLHAYVAALQAGQEPPATSECLPPRVRMAETLMLGLRLIEGVDRRAFGERFGINIERAFPQSVPRYVGQGALKLTPTHLRLSRGTYFTSDTVLADIVAEAEAENVG